LEKIKKGQDNEHLEQKGQARRSKVEPKSAYQIHTKEWSRSPEEEPQSVSRTQENPRLQLLRVKERAFHYNKNGRSTQPFLPVLCQVPEHGNQSKK
jgi:hypothetical protein